MAEHYKIDDYYTHNSSDVSALSKPPLLFRIINKIAIFFDKSAGSAVQYAKDNLPPGSMILDLGAGGGRSLLQLKEAGYNVMGVEPDPNSAALAENFQVPVYQGTGEDIPEPVKNQRFDFVICSHVLEHTNDPLKVMRNVHDILKPGGKFLAEVPNTSCLDFRLCKLNWQHLGVPRHLIFWTHRSLETAAEITGFASSKCLHRHYARQFSWNWVNFGKPMIPFYRSRGAYNISMKQFTSVYYFLLLMITVFLPAKWKYDSIILVAQREN